MERLFAISFCAMALVCASAGQTGAGRLKSGRSVAVPAAPPVLVPTPPFFPAPVYPADIACSPYTCAPGGRRIPGANPEGDVFPTNIP